VKAVTVDIQRVNMCTMRLSVCLSVCLYTSESSAFLTFLTLPCRVFFRSWCLLSWSRNSL